MGHLSSILCSHKQHIHHSTNKQPITRWVRATKRWDISTAYCAHTSNTSITAQTNTAYHKMGHLIGAAKRWDISAAYCAHTSDTSITAQTNTAYHKMGPSHQKMGHLNSILCSHKQHIYHSTNKHSLSQDGSSDRSRQKTSQQHTVLTQATHLTAQTNSLSQDGSSDRSRQDGTSQQHTVLTQATHLTAQTNTAYHKMGHLIGAAKRWDISAAYCAHTSDTSITAQTNTAYHKMGPSHQKMGCSHKQHIYHSTNKHSLSQDGSSDRSRRHVSSILCSRKQHI